MNIILTGATGYVGEGVLLTLLESPFVKKVLSVSRRSCGRTHAKLSELLVEDFFSLTPSDERLRGYDAVFYCAGRSSAGMSESDYRRLTYDMTLHFAEAVLPAPQLTFVFVSGAGTSASSRAMWARIKAQTENALQALPFRSVYCFRPAFMPSVSGQRNIHGWSLLYRYLPWLSHVFPSNSLESIARAMMASVIEGFPHSILEVRDIARLSSNLTAPETTTNP